MTDSARPLAQPAHHAGSRPRRELHGRRRGREWRLTLHADPPIRIPRPRRTQEKVLNLICRECGFTTTAPRLGEEHCFRLPSNVLLPRASGANSHVIPALPTSFPRRRESPR